MRRSLSRRHGHTKLSLMSQDFFPKNRESIPGTASNLTEEQSSGVLEAVGRETPMKNPGRFLSRDEAAGVSNGEV